NAAWSGCGDSGPPSPRTVSTALPSAWTARARHELIALPSSTTAQAPQSPRSQPDFTSVAARRWRRTPSRVSCGSTATRAGPPFTRSPLIFVPARPAPPPPAPTRWTAFGLWRGRGGGRRLGGVERLQPPAHQRPHHGAPVVVAAPHVGDGPGRGGRRLGGARDDVERQRRSGEGRLGRPRAERPGGHRAEGDGGGG